MIYVYKKDICLNKTKTMNTKKLSFTILIIFLVLIFTLKIQIRVTFFLLYFGITIQIYLLMPGKKIPLKLKEFI